MAGQLAVVTASYSDTEREEVKQILISFQVLELAAWTVVIFIAGYWLGRACSQKTKSSTAVPERASLSPIREGSYLHRRRQHG